jgi:plasmid stabilization system protein ParE
MNIHYTDTARTEEIDILTRIATDNPTAATMVALAMRMAVDRLRHFPHIGGWTDDNDVLVTISRPYNYLIFYCIEQDTVVIRNVRHPARSAR